MLAACLSSINRNLEPEMADGLSLPPSLTLSRSIDEYSPVHCIASVVVDSQFV